MSVCISFLLQTSDLFLDLETLRGEVELDSENVNEEHDRMCKELASVEASVKRLRAQNSQLTKKISDTSADVAKK